MSLAPSICQIFYVSQASVPFDSESVQSILQSSRKNNYRLDATGCLLFSGCYFAQVLEGPEEIVRALTARVATDPRHAGLKVLSERRLTTRSYNSWSMGYVHDLTLENLIEALVLDEKPADDILTTVRGRMRPDSMMGSLA